MKTLTIFLFLTMGIMSSSLQAQTVETQSVGIADIIDFVAQEYPHQEAEDQEPHKIVMALQVADGDLDVENRFILKQTFKLLSDRLNKASTVSIVAYYGLNGVVLDETPVKDLNRVYAAIESLKASVVEPQDDGLTFSYTYINNIKDEAAINTVLIVRNENAVNGEALSMSLKAQKKLKRKARNKTLLKTAVSLLPELIAIID